MFTPNLKSRLSAIGDEFKETAAYQVELAKAELAPIAKKAVIGGGFLGASAAFAMHALWILLLTAALAVCWLLHSAAGLHLLAALTLGFLIVGVMALLFAGICALIGWKQVKKIEKPQQTIDELAKTAKTVMSAVKPGSASSTDIVPGEPISGIDSATSVEARPSAA